MQTKALIEKKAAIYADMTDLKQRLKSENRGFTADELERFNKADADFTKVDNEIRAIERLEKVTNIEPQAKAIEPKAEASYRDTFVKYLRYGKKNLSSTDLGILERGTTTITTTTAGTNYGGYAVAKEFSGELNKQMAYYGGMLAACRIVNTSTGGTLDWPTLNDTSAKAVIVSEAGSSTVQDFTLGQKQFSAYTYRDLIKISAEWAQDEAVNLEGEIGILLAERFARALNEHFTTGDGSSKPTGFVTDASTGKTGAASAITHTDLIDLEHSIDPAYRNNSSVAFMFNDSTLSAIKKLSIGSSDDRPLWMPSLVAGQPDTILGYRYVINQDMASIATTNKPIAFGDWSKYIIRRVQTMNLRRLDERFADDLSTGYLAWARYDGKLLDTAAVKVFANG